MTSSCADREGEWGPGPPEKSQKYRVPSNIGPDPLKITKHSMFGHHRHVSETPFKWRFAGGPMMTFKWRFADGPMMARL